MIEKIKKACSSVYHQFMEMDDTPQRIAIGFALGFFLGILPFTGVVAAIAIAWYFGLNKPAAILGSLLANTWLSIVLFGFSVHLGSLFLGLSIQDIQAKFHHLIKNFQWSNFSDPFFLKITVVVIGAFIILSIAVTLVAYFACLAFVYWKKRPR